MTKPERNGAVLVHIDEFGILVQATEDMAERAIDRLLGEAGVVAESRSRVSASDLTAVGATVAASAAASGEYLRLSPASLASVREFGAQFDAAGALRGYVRDGGGSFAGQLVFEPVSLAAEQALALQTAAVSLALRSAIANVQATVERVEVKVDKINAQLGSRLRGDVIGTYRHLTAVVAATTDRGHLLEADWDSVAGLQASTARDVETMRALATTLALKLTRDLNVPHRRSAFRAFREEAGNVRDLLDLILVAEQSVHLSAYLRLQRVRKREPEHIASALTDARASIIAQRDLDEKLVSTLLAAVERGRGIEPLEIHHFLSKRDLDREATIFHGLISDFASASRSTLPPDLPATDEPTLMDARDAVLARTIQTAHVARAVGTAASRQGTALVRAGGARISRAVVARAPGRFKESTLVSSADEPPTSPEQED